MNPTPGPARPRSRTRSRTRARTRSRTRARTRTRTLAGVPAVSGLLAAVTALAVLSGCSGSGDSPDSGARPGPATSAPASRAASSAGPAPSSTAATRATPALPLPVDPYRLDGTDQVTLSQAQDHLVAACMKKYGTAYRAPAPRTAGPAPEAPYGITDAGWARAYGYRLPPGTQTGREAAAPSGDRTVQALLTGGITYDLDGSASVNGDQPRLREYRGEKVPEGGCIGRARRTLSGRDDNADRTVVGRRIYGEAYQKSKGDPAVVRVVRAWSACMKKAGHTYASPLDAPNDPSFPHDPPASGAEKKTAVADVACKESTDLVKVWHGAEVAAERSLMRGHTAELAAAKKDRATRLAKAREINEAHGAAK